MPLSRTLRSSWSLIILRLIIGSEYVWCMVAGRLHQMHSPTLTWWLALGKKIGSWGEYLLGWINAYNTKLKEFFRAGD